MKVKKMKKELRSMVEFKEFLKNPSPKVKVPLYTEIEVIQATTNSGDDTVKKPTLSQRMDRLEASIIKLTKTVDDGFAELRQDIKDINTRLDYIVKANNLKDSPNHK